MSALGQHSTATTMDLEFPTDALADKARARIEALGVEAEDITVEHAPVGEPVEPEGNEPWDHTVFARLFRRFSVGAVLGVAIAEVLAMIGVGIAQLAGADAGGVAGEIAVAAGVIGFDLGGFGTAMFALPSVEQINAGPAALPAHAHVVVRLGAGDDERRMASLLGEARAQVEATPRPARHAA